MNSNRPGVLILSHCGFSFLEDLKEELQRRQLRCFVLTSLPLPEHVPVRLEQIQSWADRLYIADSHQLKRDDVNNALQTLHKSGEQVTCCISVWEGYRHLMASANAALGTYDMVARQAFALRNKLEVRNQLAEAGLSQANAYALTAPALKMLQAQHQRYFIKPIHGIASYAAFPMRKDTTWKSLEELRKDSFEDTVYASAFNDGLQFMAENYITGQEFSFETLLVDGQAYVVAVHEKYEVTETADTVLEDSCTTPPASLDQAQIAAGLQWLKNVLSCLDLKWGCYHIEARFTGQYWDLIEINPRVGGSLISHSVEVVTHALSVAGSSPGEPGRRLAPRSARATSDPSWLAGGRQQCSDWSDFLPGLFRQPGNAEFSHPQRSVPGACGETYPAQSRRCDSCACPRSVFGPIALDIRPTPSGNRA